MLLIPVALWSEKIAAAAISGYFSLVLAALCVSLIYLIQPAHPSVSISAIIYNHFLAFGWLEGGITAIIAALLLNEKSPLFRLVQKKDNSAVNRNIT